MISADGRIGIMFLQVLQLMILVKFKNKPSDALVPLYEAKIFHQFDHRWATYKNSSDTRDLSDEEKSDSSFKVRSRYWLNRNEFENKLGNTKVVLLLAKNGVRAAVRFLVLAVLCSVYFPHLKQYHLSQFVQ